MKKLTALLISLLLFCCVACGQNKTLPENITCEQILNASILIQSCDNTKTYTKGKAELDTFSMAMWADGVFDECKEFDLLEDYAICYSNDNTTYEISVLKAKSKDDVQKLSELLERRKQTLTGGTKAAYDPQFNTLMQNSKIITDGSFAILLITGDNAAVVSEIEKLKE